MSFPYLPEVGLKTWQKFAGDGLVDIKDITIMERVIEDKATNAEGITQWDINFYRRIVSASDGSKGIEFTKEAKQFLEFNFEKVKYRIWKNKNQAKNVGSISTFTGVGAALLLIAIPEPSTTVAGGLILFSALSAGLAAYNFQRGQTGDDSFLSFFF